MSLVMSVCAEVSVLEFGRVIAIGEPVYGARAPGCASSHIWVRPEHLWK